MGGRSADRRITLTAEEISAPRILLARGSITVRFSDVKSVTLQQVRQQRFLSIRHGAGTLAIPASCLPDGATFEQLCAAVAEHVRAVR